MALEDLDTEQHYWYYNANGNLKDKEAESVVDFKDSNGKKKTKEMIRIYQDKEYGDPKEDDRYTDLWGLGTLKEKVEKGWFVPSRAEWSAFGDMLYTCESLPEKVTGTNCKKYNLNHLYWTSSQSSSTGVWVAYVSKGYTLRLRCQQYLQCPLECNFLIL